MTQNISILTGCSAGATVSNLKIIFADHLFLKVIIYFGLLGKFCRCTI